MQKRLTTHLKGTYNDEFLGRHQATLSYVVFCILGSSHFWFLM